MKSREMVKNERRYAQLEVQKEPNGKPDGFVLVRDHTDPDVKMIISRVMHTFQWYLRTPGTGAGRGSDIGGGM